MTRRQTNKAINSPPQPQIHHRSRKRTRMHEPPTLSTKTCTRSPEGIPETARQQREGREATQEGHAEHINSSRATVNRQAYHASAGAIPRTILQHPLGHLWVITWNPRVLGVVSRTHDNADVVWCGAGKFENERAATSLIFWLGCESKDKNCSEAGSNCKRSPTMRSWRSR